MQILTENECHLHYKSGCDTPLRILPGGLDYYVRLYEASCGYGGSAPAAADGVFDERPSYREPVW